MPLAGTPVLFMYIYNQFYLDDENCVLPGAEIICHNRRDKMAVVSGHIINIKTGKCSKKLFEIEQKILPECAYLPYETSKEEVIRKIAVDNYQVVCVNGYPSNAASAVFAIKNSAVLIVTADNEGIFIVKSTTQDGYVEITVELRY